MKEEHEALRIILDAIPPPEPVSLPLEEAGGHYAAEEVRATIPLPGFDNSAMDGYALHAADCERTGHRVAVGGAQPAGTDAGLSVEPGKAVRIFTGAPLPRDTAAILMQEDAEADEDGILIREAAEPGEFIRRAGSDLECGCPVVAAGDLLTPERLGVLASQGRSTVMCGRRPGVRVICTGSELVAAGNPLPGRGYLYNSNGPMLVARFRAAGFAAGSRVLADDAVALTGEIANALDHADVLVLAAGVSVGDHDHVVSALAMAGVSPEFHRVRLKPGKPLLFARSGGKLIFGLPGNPVSATVTCVLFVLPALQRMAGASVESSTPPRLRAITASSLSNRGDRPHYVRGVYDSRSGTFQPSGIQESHALFGMSRCNALLKVQAGTSLAAGSAAECVLL